MSAMPFASGGRNGFHSYAPRAVLADYLAAAGTIDRGLPDEGRR